MINSLQYRALTRTEPHADADWVEAGLALPTLPLAGARRLYLNKNKQIIQLKKI